MSMMADPHRALGRRQPVPSYDVPLYDGGIFQAEYNTNMENQSIWKKISRSLLVPPGDKDFKAFREILPFYLMVTLVMVWIYIQVLRTSPTMEDPLLLTAFSILLVIHLILYWLTIYFSVNQKRIYLYLFIQGVIAFIIVLVTLSDVVVMALFTAMIGNAIGMLGKSKASLVAFLYYLMLAVVSLAIVIVSPQIESLLYTLLPVAAFTAFFAYFFSNQIEARGRVQRLLDELEEAHQQLTEYTVQLEELTLAAERQRIARELHDTLAQGLAGLILQLEAAVIHIEGHNSDKAKQIVEQAMARARTTLVDARHAIDDLRAEINSPEALEDSLTAEVTRFQNATGIPCKLQISLLDQVESKLSEHILRIVAEGLSNIARHAEASQASVSVGNQPDQLVIEVIDDGIGFDSVKQVGRSGHYGLLGIRERTRLANGQFSIESAPGKGTKLLISLPIAIKVEETNE
jgi:NarL family two-component system sensor histidine kinase YdfH